MADIDLKVFDGIRKTINRFREKPFHYFTEADIHSSLLNDMMSGGSDVLAFRPEDENKKHISVSLVHQEYPTNFRYKKEDMITGYSDLKITELGHADENNKAFGDRGNYDLAVLSTDFAVKMLGNETLQEALEHLINKDNQRAISRKAASSEDFKRELLYAIEVKFIHAFNARSKNMLYEVIKDDQKLYLAHYHSDGFVKPINLVFCSSASKERSDDQQSVIHKVRDYIMEMKTTDYDGIKVFRKVPEVVTIFIESYLENVDFNQEQDFRKITVKPILSGGIGQWASDLKDVLGLQ